MKQAWSSQIVPKCSTWLIVPLIACLAALKSAAVACKAASHMDAIHRFTTRCHFWSFHHYSIMVTHNTEKGTVHISAEAEFQLKFLNVLLVCHKELVILIHWKHIFGSTANNSSKKILHFSWSDYLLWWWKF